MCDFPAKQLIAEQRRICAEADKTDDPARVSDAADYVRLTNMLRLRHEDLTECRCWYSAVQEANSVQPSA